MGGGGPDSVGTAEEKMHRPKRRDLVQPEDHRRGGKSRGKKSLTQEVGNVPWDYPKKRTLGFWEREGRGEAENIIRVKKGR